MSLRLIYVVCILISGAGCHTHQDKKTPSFWVLDVRKNETHYPGYPTATDTYVIALCVSNTLEEAILVYNLTPGWQPCAVEVLESGVWTNINPFSYDAAGHQIVSIGAQQSRQFSLVFVGIQKPWRITADYFLESKGLTTVYKMTTSHMSPTWPQ